MTAVASAAAAPSDIGRIRGRRAITDRLAAPEYVFEPGEFVIGIGGSSENLGTQRLVWRCDKR